MYHLSERAQHADDTSLALDGSPKSLFAALDTFDLFFKIIWIECK
jgi:hypothetical protein